MAAEITKVKKFYSVSEISEMFGFSKDTVREFCNSRGQKFAFKPNGGKFYIDLHRFREYLDRKRREGA